MGQAAEQIGHGDPSNGTLSNDLTASDPSNPSGDTERKKFDSSERSLQLTNAFIDLSRQELALVDWADQHPTEFSEETRAAMRRGAEISNSSLAVMASIVNLENALGVVPLEKELPHNDLPLTVQHQQLMQHIFPVFSKIILLLPKFIKQWPNDEAQIYVTELLKSARSYIKDGFQMVNTDLLNHIWQELSLTRGEDFKAVETARKKAEILVIAQTPLVTHEDLLALPDETLTERLTTDLTHADRHAEEITHLTEINQLTGLASSALKSDWDQTTGRAYDEFSQSTRDAEAAIRELMTRHSEREEQYQRVLDTINAERGRIAATLGKTGETIALQENSDKNTLDETVAPGYPRLTDAPDEFAIVNPGNREISTAIVESETQPSPLIQVVGKFREVTAQAGKALLAAGNSEAYAQLADAQISDDTLKILEDAATALEEIAPEKANEILAYNEPTPFTGLAREYQLHAHLMMRIIDATNQLLKTDRQTLDSKKAQTLDDLDSSITQLMTQPRRGTHCAHHGLLAMRQDVDYGFATLQQIQRYQ